MYLSTKYFQKSYHLLLPFTGIPREGTFKPSNTYLYSVDEQLDDISNCYLIVTYDKNNNPLYKEYEKQVLLKCENLVSCYITDNHYVYIFNVIEWANEVYNFLEGKYSKFSDKAKLHILKWAGGSQLSRRKIEGFTVHVALCPEYYHEDIAKELGYSDTRYIKECWEMWSKPDIHKETYTEYVLDEKEICERKPQILTEILN